ncbi:MAG: DUF4209 domain-containing protein [Nanoarchaeota archaeon]|nr:DUF4209 domain-containing protein [Nanoarchaeota archaeon]
MANYNQEMIKAQIKDIMNTQYERMYPFEIEKALSPIFKTAEENNDEQIKKEILWEIDLLNRAFGHKGKYQGKEVVEISNKWKHFLDNGNFKPFSNPPFCEWKKEAFDYYKLRYNQAESELAKARYAFAIMVFSSGQEKLGWMKKSVEGWLKTAEKYVADGVFNKEYYEIPPFAYEFALKLSLAFGQRELAKNVLDSLHTNILTILESEEKRWHLEFLEVESNYINSFDDIESIKNESVNKIKEIIGRLKQNFEQSTDKHKSNHFLRSHLQLLLKYNGNQDYDTNEKIAESYAQEANAREEPLVKSSFLNDAIKKYKSMQGSYPEKKEVIDKKIEDLILKIKEVNTKITYKQIQAKFEITKKQIDSYLDFLRSKGGSLLKAFLDDSSLFPQYNKTVENTLEQKKQSPLQFMISITVYNAEEPVMRITSDDEIFDHHVRRNILFGIKVGEIMCKMTLESLKKELGEDFSKEIEALLDQEELIDIKPALKSGFDFVLEKSDYITGIHVLTPYIEELIRRIVKKAGKVEVILEQHKTKFFRGIMLDSLLENENVKSLIGLDFQKSLKVLLTDRDQTNLRNELLHGRLPSDKINEAEVLFVSYCLLKLLRILKEVR